VLETRLIGFITQCEFLLNFISLLNYHFPGFLTQNEVDFLVEIAAVLAVDVDVQPDRLALGFVFGMLDVVRRGQGSYLEWPFGPVSTEHYLFRVDFHIEFEQSVLHWKLGHDLARLFKLNLVDVRIVRLQESHGLNHGLLEWVEFARSDPCFNLLPHKVVAVECEHRTQSETLVHQRGEILHHHLVFGAFLDGAELRLSVNDHAHAYLQFVPQVALRLLAFPLQVGCIQGHRLLHKLQFLQHGVLVDVILDFGFCVEEVVCTQDRSVALADPCRLLENVRGLGVESVEQTAFAHSMFIVAAVVIVVIDAMAGM